MPAEFELPKYPPLFFVRFTDYVRRILLKISRKFTHPNVVMLEYVQNLWLLGSISVATELGIADILKSGPKTIGEIALLTGTLEDPLYRIMRLLSSEGIFRELSGMRFSNTKISESMQEKELKFFIQHSLNSMQFRIFGDLMHSIKTGRSTSELFFKTGVFEHMGQSKELNELYNKAMTNTSKMQVAAVLEAFNFGRYKHIVDVGGGLGFFISAILSRYKTVQGTLFDLQQVVENHGEFLKGNDLSGRLTIRAGSFYDIIPEGGDLYILKNILHGWNDDDSIRILKNIGKAMPVNGKLMIVEVVVEDMNKSSFGKMTDIFMMAGLGGRERTREEYQRVLNEAGFKIDRIRHTVSPLSIIIASR